MTGAEKVLETMKTPEWKEKADKFLKDYVAKCNANEREMKIIFSNTEYINWLINFTNDNHNFTDEDWDYFPEKISEYDLNYVQDFHLFYNGIDKYASQNYIYPEYNAFGNFYRIKFNDVGFEIGTQAGQGVYFYCVRIDISDNLMFIDFNDILNNKKQIYVDEINNGLNNLSEMIMLLYNSGVPLEVIVSTVNKTIKNIDEDKSKSMLVKRLAK